ncbi:MAG: RDD family protein [Myxococcota bacterium]
MPDYSHTNPFDPLPASARRPPAPGMATDAVLAARGTRLAARLLDQALFYGPVMLIAVVAMGLPDDASDVMGIFFGLCALSWLVLIPTQWYFIGTRGQSLGKMALKIRVVDSDGRNPGWLRALLYREGARGLLGAVPYLGLVVSLIDSLMIFRRDYRTWHDQLANLYVVRAPGAGLEDGDAPRLSEVRSPGGGGGGATLVLGAAVALLAIGGIGVAAAIAIPNFITMQMKAKRSEVPANVDGIVAAERAYHAANGAWLPVSNEAAAMAEVSGKAPRDWAGGADWDALGWAPSGTVRGAYWVEVSPDGAEILVRGICDVDGDGDLAVYSTDADARAEMTTDANVY